MLLGNCVDQCHTGSTKPAIEGMSRHLAVEWGPDGIRVNCVAPGAVKDTEGFRRLEGKHLPPNFIENLYLYKDWFLTKMWQMVYSFWQVVLQLLSQQTHWQ
nr:peroxisomal 2,4-dienoyl-CoA reductase [(3E)-enoyl-CoA-producing]-like [Pocillopora verrucosa]